MKVMKRIITGCLVIAMLLGTIIVAPIKAEATDSKVVHYDETNTYKISDYWAENEKKAPLKSGYVFGGWYQKDGETFLPIREASLSDESVKTMTAYPKFVPAQYISIKTQVGTQGEGDSKSTSLRVISLIDSNQYKEAGFEYQLGSRSVAKVKMSSVYTAIKLNPADNETVRPMQVYGEGADGYYFTAFDVSGISENSFASIVYARPYWITMDGTEVKGLARNNRVEDNDNSADDYLSVPINLLTDGLVPEKVAAGKIVVTYNSEKFDVATKDESYKVDTGRVFDNMLYHVDESQGTITFVGDTENLVDVTADGLYANIRFVKTDAEATDSDLNFAFSVKEFCDYEEEFCLGFSVQ